MKLETLQGALEESLTLPPVGTFHLMLNVEHQRELLGEIAANAKYAELSLELLRRVREDINGCGEILGHTMDAIDAALAAAPSGRARADEPPTARTA